MAKSDLRRMLDQDRRHREWLRETASAGEIMVHLSGGTMEEKGEVARKVIAARAERRDPTSIERDDLKSLSEGKWGEVVGRALDRDKHAQVLAQKTRAAVEEQQHQIAERQIRPEWVLAVWSTERRKGQRLAQRLANIEQALCQAGVPTTELRLIRAAIGARLQAMQACISSTRGVRQRLASLLQSDVGRLQLARLISEEPIKVGTRLMPGLKTAPAIVFTCGSDKLVKRILEL